MVMRYLSINWRTVHIVPTGWVFGGQIMRIGTKITTASKVRMRSEPNIKASLVKTLKKGIVVNAIARSTHQDKIANNLDYWYQVKSADGKVGWIFGSLLMSVGFPAMPLYTILEHTIQETDETDELAETLPWSELDCGGTEPFWNITISDQGVQYKDAEQQSMNFPVFSLDVSSNEPNVWSIKAKNKANQKSAVLFLQQDRCDDGMSDHDYKYHIFVRFHNDRVLSGCCD